MYEFDGASSSPQINSEERIIPIATTTLSGLSCIFCVSTSLILVTTVVRGYDNIQRVIFLMVALTDLASSVLAATSSWILPESNNMTEKTTSCSWTLTAVTFVNGLTSCSLIAIVFEIHDTLINGQFKQLTGKRLFFLVTFTSLLNMIFALYHHPQNVASYGLRLIDNNQTVCSFRTTALATRFDRVVYFLQITAVAVFPILGVLVQSLNIARHAVQKFRHWRKRELAGITTPNIKLKIAVDFLRSKFFKLSMTITCVKFFFQFPFLIITMTARITPSPLTNYITISQMINQVGILTSSVLYCPLLSTMHVVHWKNMVHHLYCNKLPCVDNTETTTSTSPQRVNIELAPTQTSQY